MKELMGGGGNGVNSSPLRLSIGGSVYEQIVGANTKGDEVISLKKLDSRVATPYRNVLMATHERTPPAAYQNLLKMVLSTTTPGGTREDLGEKEMNLMAPTPTTARKNPTGHTPAAHKTPGNTRRKKGMLLKAMSPDDWQDLVGVKVESAILTPSKSNFEPNLNVTPNKSGGGKEALRDRQRASMSRLSVPKTPPSVAKENLEKRRKSVESRAIFDKSSPSKLAKSIYMDTKSPAPPRFDLGDRDSDSNGTKRRLSSGAKTGSMRARSNSMGSTNSNKAVTPKLFQSPTKDAGKRKPKKAVGFASPASLSLAEPAPPNSGRSRSDRHGSEHEAETTTSRPRSPRTPGGGSPRAKMIQSASKELDKVWALINSSPMRRTPDKFTPRKGGGAGGGLAGRRQTPGPDKHAALKEEEEDETEGWGQGQGQPSPPAPIPFTGANFKDSPTEEHPPMPPRAPESPPRARMSLGELLGHPKPSPQQTGQKRAPSGKEEQEQEVCHSGEDTDEEDRTHMDNAADASVIFMRRRGADRPVRREGEEVEEGDESGDLEATVALSDLLGTSNAAASDVSRVAAAPSAFITDVNMSVSVATEIGGDDADKENRGGAVSNGKHHYIPAGEKMGDITLMESPIVAPRASSARNAERKKTGGNGGAQPQPLAVRRSARCRGGTPAPASPAAAAAAAVTPPPSATKRVTRSASKSGKAKPAGQGQKGDAPAVAKGERSAGRRRRKLAESAEDLIAQIDGCLA